MKQQKHTVGVMRKQTVSFPFEVPQNKEAAGRYVFGRGQVAMERVTIPPPPPLPTGTTITVEHDTERPPLPSPTSFDEWIAMHCSRRAEARNEANAKACAVVDELEGRLGRRSGAKRDRCSSEALEDLLEALQYEHEEDAKLLEHLKLLQLDVSDSERTEEA